MSDSLQQQAASELYAGGDIHVGNITQTINQYKPEFEELKNLELSFTSDFISPHQEIIAELVEILDNNRLLVIYGDDIEKHDFVWYLAWYFSKYSKQFNRVKGKESAILEWQHSSIRQIEVEFQQSKDASIYLFAQVSPQEIGETGSDFLSIIKNASKKHFVIVTTEIHKAVWKFSQEETISWKEVTSHQLYHLNDLVKILFNAFKNKKFQDWEQINELQKTLKTHFNENDIDKLSNSNITDHFTFKIIVDELQTPRKITRFVSVLYTELQNQEQKLNDILIEKLIEKIQAYPKLNHWYYHILTPRERLLALGLNLFSGLYEDQFFAALEEVVENAWQKRNPDLQALDYCDLDNLGNFFTLPITKDSRNQEIKSNISKRSQLFEVAWNYHGRQILATLPTITHLVKNSVANRSFRGELYGTPERNEKIQTVLTETVSEIGCISPIAVRETLRQLASDNELEVQRVAVHAIARWCTFGRQKDLFEILNAWLNECISVLKNRKQDHIRATVALTIGYATEYYDLPNDHKYQKYYYNLLKQLSDLQKNDNEDNPAHVSFCVYMLPTVVRIHFKQQSLRDLLCDMTQYPNLVDTISDLLAKEYKNYPKEVLELLETWQQNKNLFHKSSLAKEPLLSTIALTYGKIECDKEIYPFTATQAFDQLKKLLNGEKNFLVFRLAIISAMCMKLQQNFYDIESLFQQFIPEITQYEHEREKIVEGLKNIYLNKNPIQKSNPVEIAMRRWVKNENNPIAQNIALQAFVNFILASSKGEKTKQIKTKFLDISVLPKQPILSQKPPDKLTFPFILTLLRIVTWRKNKSYKNVLHNLLYEVNKYYYYDDMHKNVIKKVLSNWKKTKNDNKYNDIDIATLSNLLRRSLWYINNFEFFIFGLIGSVLFIFILIDVRVSVIESQQHPPSSTTVSPVSTTTSISTTSTEMSKPFQKSQGIIESDEPSLLIAEKTTVRDIDSDNFDQGELIVTFLENATGYDRIGIRQPKTDTSINIDGNNISYKNEVFGHFQGGGNEPLIVKLNHYATPLSTTKLIHHIVYQNLLNNPQIGDRKIQLQLMDGDGGISNSLIKTISVIQNNQAPIINVPSDINTEVKENHQLKMSGITLSDLESQTVITTFVVENGKLIVKQNVSNGLNAKNIKHNNTKRVELRGTLEKINTTLADNTAITYRGNPGFNGNDFLSIIVKDSGKKMPNDDGLVWPPDALEPKMAFKTIHITVIPAIILTVPDDQIVDEDTNLIMSGIHIQAPESKNATVILEVSNGTLAIKNDVVGGVTRRNIQGNKTAKVTLKRSTISQLNATFEDSNAIVYRSDPNFSGDDTLIIQVSDGNKSASQHINIRVVPVNDEPQIIEEEINKVPLHHRTEKTTGISYTPQETLGKSVIDSTDVQYKNLPSPSPRKWWNLICKNMKKIYIQEVVRIEVAKIKTIEQQEKQQIWWRVFNGTVDVIYQDEIKKRNGWSRKRIENKLSACK